MCYIFFQHKRVCLLLSVNRSRYIKCPVTKVERNSSKIMAVGISMESYEKHLNCSICMELFSDPRALPCMHTFCQKCLQSYILSLLPKRDVNSLGFECPVCRNVIKAPREGLQADEWANRFTPNYAVKGLLEEHVDQCVKRGSSNSEMNKLACYIHSEKTAEFKCGDHSPERLCCAVCAVRKHKQCGTLSYLGDEEEISLENGDNCDMEISLEKRRTLSRLAHIDLIESLESQTIAKDFERSQTKQANLLMDIMKNTKHTSPHQSLRRETENFHSHSFEECEDLRWLSATALPSDTVAREQTGNREDIRNALPTAPPFEMIYTSNETAGSNDFENENIGMTSQISRSKESDQVASGVRASREHTNKTDSHPGLRRLVRGEANHSFEENEDLQKLASKTNSNCFEKRDATDVSSKGRRSASRGKRHSDLHKQLSVISETLEDTSYLKDSQNKSDNSSQNDTFSMKSSLVFSEEISVKLAEDCKVCSITGICSLPDGKVLLADGNNYKVKVFDHMGHSLTYHTLPSEPWDIDAVGDCEAVVSLPQVMCLFTLIIHDQVSIGRRIDVGKKCYGVVYSNMEFIITCSNDIRIFSYNGEFKTKILKDKKSLVPNLRSPNPCPRYICINPTDSNKLYISDKNRGLLCASRNGDVLSITSCDRGGPLGVACSSNGTLLVCHIPNYLTIYVINNDGSRTKDILSLDKIHNVNFNKLDQRLWVCKRECDTMSIYSITY